GQLRLRRAAGADGPFDPRARRRARVVLRARGRAPRRPDAPRCSLTDWSSSGARVREFRLAARFRSSTLSPTSVAGEERVMTGPNGRLWHVTLTVAGDPVEPMLVRAALSRLREERPFID